MYLLAAETGLLLTCDIFLYISSHSLFMILSEGLKVTGSTEKLETSNVSLLEFVDRSSHGTGWRLGSPDRISDHSVHRHQNLPGPCSIPATRERLNCSKFSKYFSKLSFSE